MTPLPFMVRPPLLHRRILCAAGWNRNGAERRTRAPRSWEIMDKKCEDEDVEMAVGGDLSDAVGGETKNEEDKVDKTCAAAVWKDDRTTFFALLPTLDGSDMLTLRAAIAARESAPIYYETVTRRVRSARVFEAAVLEANPAVLRAVLGTARNDTTVLDAVIVRLFESYDPVLANVLRAVPELFPVVASVVERHVIPCLSSCYPRFSDASVTAFAAFLRDGFRSPCVIRLVHDARSVAVLLAADSVSDYHVGVESRLRALLECDDKLGLDLLLAMCKRDGPRMARLIDAHALLFRVPVDFQPALLAAGANVNALDPVLRTSLLNMSICHNRVDAVALLMARPDVNPNVGASRGRGGCPPVALPFRNGCLGNAVRMLRYDLALALLDLPTPARTGSTFAHADGVYRPLLQDGGMPMDLFKRLLPFANMPAHRDNYLHTWFCARNEGAADAAMPKVAHVMRHHGASVSFVVSATKTLCDSAKTSRNALMSLIRAAVAGGIDPCAFDDADTSMFAVLHRCARTAVEHVAFVNAFVSDTRERALAVKGNATVLNTVRAAWNMLELYARSLPDEHPDAVTRFTGLDAEEYLDIARRVTDAGAGAGAGAVRVASAAFQVSMRALRAWRRTHKQSRKEELFFRYAGLLWAFRVILRPSLMLEHRVRVMARAAAHMRELGSQAGPVIDHVTGDPVEPDNAHRCVLFSPAKVWSIGRAPPQRFCVDVVNFARATADRAMARASVEGLIMNGIHYDGASCADLMGVYRAHKARMDPSREAWLSLENLE